MVGEFDYDVFISYRTSISPDREIGQALQGLLEAFPVPKPLANCLVIPRSCHLKVFRDVTDLNPTADLDDALKEKLRRSRFLIVVCTEQMRQSSYCANEVQYFSEVHGRNKIVLLLAKGEPHSAFPVQMLSATGVTLSADTRSDTDLGIIRRLQGKRVPRAQRVIYKLLAPILGCSSPDELVRRDRQRFRRNVLRATVILFILFLAISIPKGVWDYATFRLRFADARYDDDRREIMIYRQFNPFNWQMGTMLFEDELEGPSALNRVEQNSVLCRGFSPDWEQLVPLMSDRRKALAEVRMESTVVGNTRLLLAPRSSSSDLREIAAWCSVSPLIQSRILAIAHDEKENMGYRLGAADALKLSGTDVALGGHTANDQSQMARQRMAELQRSFSKISTSTPFSRSAELGNMPSHVEDIVKSRNLGMRSRAVRDLSRYVLSNSISDTARKDVDGLSDAELRHLYEVCLHFVHSPNSRVRMHSHDAIAMIYAKMNTSSDSSRLLDDLASPNSATRMVAAILLGNKSTSDMEDPKIRSCQTDSRPWVRQGASLALFFSALRKIPSGNY